MLYNRDMEAIGIFGGTFDPPHLEHAAMARAAAEQLKLDRLFVVPAAIPPHKRGKKITDAADRLEMARLAFRDVPCAVVSDAEIRAEGPSFSYLTAEKFAAEYPGCRRYFVLGEDMFENFPSWREPERILAAARLAVCGRRGNGDRARAEKAFAAFGRSFVRLNCEGRAVSATEVRVRLMLGLSVAGTVDGRVREYIANKGLYRPPEAVARGCAFLTEKRKEHTAGVCELALRYAERTGEDEGKVFLAAALHDVAKNLSPADYPRFVPPAGVPESVVHAFLGAFVAERVLGVTDADVLSAVRWHTSGRAGMSALEKIVYTADMLEKNRDFPGAEELRDIAETDFEAGFRACVAHSYRYLEKSRPRGEIFAATRQAYEYYPEEGKQS